MGFGAVAAGAIILTITLITVAALSTILFTIMTNTVENVLNSKDNYSMEFTISSMIYDDINNVLYINITNTGQYSIIPYHKTELILDYVDTTGRHEVDVLEYGGWRPYKTYVGNYSYLLPKDKIVEIPPGAILEIIAHPSYTIDASYPIVIVFILDSGIEAKTITKLR